MDPGRPSARTARSRCAEGAEQSVEIADAKTGAGPVRPGIVLGGVELKLERAPAQDHPALVLEPHRKTQSGIKEPGLLETPAILESFSSLGLTLLELAELAAAAYCFGGQDRQLRAQRLPRWDWNRSSYCR